MNAKKYLKQIQQLDREIDRKICEKNKIYASLFKSSKYQPDLVSKSRSSRLDDTYAKIIDLSNEIDSMVDRLVDMKVKVTRLIDQLEDRRNRAVLSYRYVAGKRWEEIAEIMGYEVRWVYRLHGQALKEFDKITRNL
ncbi:DUF1492 domain-containing protein [Atopobacter sp. AH10]|uniref:DUF1492 domain-containing protein n=1 Tax=Atopobacter sp. AH10 TaxID=2315861 RepID=UPI000EF1B873|nr:DUF1492 domain-containing protein [Atopobacter sp. AH10]RLK63168.1 DUF1492 domain-containing protein [Atopobacter sp. AH10]